MSLTYPARYIQLSNPSSLPRNLPFSQTIHKIYRLPAVRYTSFYNGLLLLFAIDLKVFRQPATCSPNRVEYATYKPTTS